MIAAVRAAPLAARLRGASYLRKWVVLGALIGLVSGTGAVIFFEALDLGTRLLLGTIAGWPPATPVGEGGAPIVDPVRPWAVPLVVAAGGLIAGVIVFRLAPEAEGHGTDAAISAFHHGPRGIRGRIPLIKLVASAITIGSGGSGGREGPTAQIGAGFGSFLSRRLDLDARDARIAVAAGMAAGIGAIFRAPLGGAVLGAEIPYRDDVESDALVPSFVASVVAYSIFGAVVGWSPIFGRVSGAAFSDVRQLAYYVVIGAACGLVGRVYITSFYGAGRWFRRLALPREVRPALAGFVVGCIGLLLPGALGTGYGWVQAALSRDVLLSLPLWAVLALPFGKIAATSLSIGSGASGGIFGPGMVIGGLLGASLWRILEPVAPAVPADPSAFVLVAMMALFGSIAHAPLAVILMVAEMSDNLGMLAPAMIAIGVAVVIVGDRSIYASQLRSRAESPAHRFRFALPMLTAIPVADAARPPRLVLRASESVGQARVRLAAEAVPGAPVVDGETLRGIVTAVGLAPEPAERRLADVATVAPAITVTDALDDALGTLADHHASWAPVVDDGRLVGVLSARDVMRAYRTALAGNVRRVRGIGAAGSLVEADLATESPLADRTLAEADLPRDVVLVSIERSDRTIVPRGDVVLRAGDRLFLYAKAAAIPALEAALATTLASPAETLDGGPEADPEAPTRIT
ncbi:MAG TPA: chloride channel protein [Candidatus Limnocylindrales bacterium]|nr:chloride channel protein [Candidatus Limnocylindrales bacterium]